MKLKSLLFGSAAVLAAGTGAQAADLPTAEPVEYVRICDAFGAGFHYIPGTDTCLAIGGRVRVDASYVDGDVFERFAIPTPDFNNFSTRARADVDFDARTQTDFGLIRAFIAYRMQIGTDNSSLGDPNYAEQAELIAAFIQISNDMGTFTAGHAGSFFNFFGTYGYASRVGIDDPTTEATLFAYTFSGGNGFSATLSVEDPASRGARLNGDDDYEGQELPDLVGNIRIDQGWGSAQIMGALRHIHDITGDGVGWAIGAGVTAGLSSTIEASLEAGYSEGAIAYLTNDPGPNVGLVKGIGDFNGPDGSDTNEAWTVRGGLKAGFTPTVTGNINASYTYVEEDDSGDDYDLWAATAGIVWQPVSGLTMGPEVQWESIDGDDAIFGEDSDIWGVTFRVQRDF